MILADLHVHSTFSDGKMSIPQLVDFYGARGFGCIAITDHICEQKSFLGFAAGALKYTLSREMFPQYLDLIRSEAERAWTTYKMQVIPGFELSKNSLSHHRSAHVLGIGVTEWMPAELDILQITKGLRDQGAISIAAHPVHTGLLEPQTLHLWSRREDLSEEFDAWEVASGRKFFHEVHASGLPMIATSDLHHAKQISSWKTLLRIRPGERSIDAVLDAVREQRLEFGLWEDGDRRIVRRTEARVARQSSGATRQPVMVPFP